MKQEKSSLTHLDFPLNLLKYKSEPPLSGMQSLLTYNGTTIDYGTVNQLLKNFSSEAKKLGLPLKVFKRSYSVADEIIENIRYHSDDISPNKINIDIYYDSDSIYIKAENLATPLKAVKAREKADFLRDCSLDQIKTIFKEKITSLKPDNTKGAGLGLIIISKKSQRINYECSKFDKNSFLLKQYIQIKCDPICL